MTSEWTLIMGAAGAFSWFLNLAVQLVFLVVILVVVRKYRPDSTPILIGAVVFDLVVTTASYASNVVLPQLVSGSSGGIRTYAAAQAITGSVFALAHAAARALLIWGIVKLARPAERA